MLVPLHHQISKGLKVEKIIKKKILPILILVLFNVYQVNVLLFTHVHYIHGIPVAHTHPNGGDHRHPDTGGCFIACFFKYYSAKVDTPFNLSVETHILNVFQFIYTTTLLEGIHLKLPSLRAPPVNC